MNNKRKNKRTKVQCLSCDSVLDHDYSRKYELNIRGGSRVKMIDVSVGEANNPFAAAELNFELKVSKTNSDNTSPFNESVVDEVSKRDSDNVPINTKCVHYTSPYNESVVSEIGI